MGHIMSLQVPGVLLPHGPGVLLCCPAAPQTAAVRNEGSHQDVEGARGGRPGTRQIQRRSAGYDSHRVGQRSVAGGMQRGKGLSDMKHAPSRVNLCHICVFLLLLLLLQVLEGV